MQTITEWFGVEKQDTTIKDGNVDRPMITDASLSKLQTKIMAGEIILKDEYQNEFVIRNGLLCPIVRA